MPNSNLQIATRDLLLTSYRFIAAFFCRFVAITVLAMLAATPALAKQAQDPNEQFIKISLNDYQDKVYASWLGQIIGNTYGLSYEFKFIEQPGPDKFPYGYGEKLALVDELNGAFSDDDTDIEYMYLLAMEQHGIEPTYAQLTSAWKYHVNDRVWFANRAAVSLMHAGFSPPLTGNKTYNAEWFQIDPQLVNEIWAVTAPGMINYASAKTHWAAKITNDSFGIEPALHYAAMFSAAFFEKDIDRLINIGTAALPEGAYFKDVVEHMKLLYQQHPDDWQSARKKMAQKYYGSYDYNSHSWAAVDAILNGACAILALLYGEGDFQKTLDISSALGFDADNQAATLSGLLGVRGGMQAIPKSLQFPLKNKSWTKPFNDRYINVSRHDLPNASIQDMAKRIARQGEKIIFANGGKKILQDGIEYYLINTEATYSAPLELPTAPVLFAEQGKVFNFKYHQGNPSKLKNTQIDKDKTAKFTYRLNKGKLPKGLKLKANSITGTPKSAGSFNFEVQVKQGNNYAVQRYQIDVHSKNLAQDASQVLHNTDNEGIELIRDGQRSFGSATFSSAQGNDTPKVDYYGFIWDKPQDISVILFNSGYIDEFGGWFKTLEVQYLNTAGDWRQVTQLTSYPPMSLDDNHFLKGKFIDRTLTFLPLTTKGIRIIGAPGAVTPDDPKALKQFYSTISELSVHKR
ncbi:MAG: Fe-S cluster assembly protein HesB [Alteromonadaceae bacterium]|nr:MAG: Fe-S cluster assembly protein HesB [Alteromonadaceae bacterium]